MRGIVPLNTCIGIHWDGKFYTNITKPSFAKATAGSLHLRLQLAPHPVSCWQQIVRWLQGVEAINDVLHDT